MRLKFYGTRGSIPTPSTPDFSTVNYGGNTTCMRITDDKWNKDIIIDAGSGMRMLGLDYFKEQNFNVHAAILLTHYHHDHIQGIPFFPQMYMASCDFEFYGPAMDGINDNTFTQVQEFLRHEQLPPFFPVHHDRMPSDKDYFDVVPGNQFKIDPEIERRFGPSIEQIVIKTFPLNHPNGGMGYRIEYGGKSICIATDSEHFSGPNQTFAKMCKDTDLIVCDGQYTDAEYNDVMVPKQGWGHGTFNACIDEMIACNAKKMVITHHDPSHDDEMLDEINNLLENHSNEALDICLSKEGMEIEV